jgi:hypothetical protein
MGYPQIWSATSTSHWLKVSPESGADSHRHHRHSSNSEDASYYSISIHIIRFERCSNRTGIPLPIQSAKPSSQGECYVHPKLVTNKNNASFVPFNPPCYVVQIRETSPSIVPHSQSTGLVADDQTRFITNTRNLKKVLGTLSHAKSAPDGGFLGIVIVSCLT